MEQQQHAGCFVYGVPANVTSGYLYPLYQVLAVIYAPPGSAGGKSSVSYADQSTTGSSLAITESLADTFSIQATAGDKVTSVGGGFELSVTSATTQTLTVSKTATNTIQDVAIGANDGINHDDDLFYLQINPVLSVSTSQNWITSWTSLLSSTANRNLHLCQADQLPHRCRKSHSRSCHHVSPRPGLYPGGLQRDLLAQSITPTVA